MESFTKYIVFQLNDQQYGINIDQVVSIERIQDITEVSQVASYIKGITHIREEVTVIIDLNEKLKGIETSLTNDTRLLVVKIEDMQIGLIVDAANDVIDLESSIIEAAPTILDQEDKRFIDGIAKLEDKLLILLNIHALFADVNLTELYKNA